MNKKRYFLLTIDTEGDNLWSQPIEITTHNSKYLDRFQRLCERFNFKPTYLVNYEMAKCNTFQKLAIDYLSKNTAEIGMHLHAWNSPPLYDLTGNDLYHQPYLIEYPLHIMEDKIQFMTHLITDTFECNIASHRAGRWAINTDYVKMLEKYDYQIDCSVTPFVSWVNTSGSPTGVGGSDYSNYPDYTYYVDSERLDLRGNSKILEIPMTIITTPSYLLLKPFLATPFHHLIRRLLNRFWPTMIWLRPNGKNLGSMKWLVSKAIDQDRDYIMFMLHSSEFMPGGSSTFDTPQKIEKLFSDIEQLFKAIANDFVGATLSEYRNSYVTY